MITVGLVQELAFVSHFLKTPVYLKMATEKNSGVLNIILKDQYLELVYKQNKIWKEKVLSPESMFGIESCETILKIISLIDAENEKWKNLCFFE
jgi:hypothetical protein